MNFLKNKYGYTNGLAMLMMATAGLLDVDGFFKGLLLGFGSCLFIVTLYMCFKLMKEDKNKENNEE